MGYSHCANFGSDVRTYFPCQNKTHDGGGEFQQHDFAGGVTRDEAGHPGSFDVYFDLDTDYANVARLINESEDEHLKEAYSKGSGVRILRQDLWEIIVSFIISQNNNISRITQSIDKICTRCELPALGGEYRFPYPGEVEPEFWDDSTLGLGYRNEYLKLIYEYAKENPKWLDELKTMSYDDAMQSLMERKGIGKKVANCICLFGLHHVDAFPIDTHVKQLLAKYYQNGFDFDRYKGVAGIVQQYLFYYEIS